MENKFKIGSDHNSADLTKDWQNAERKDSKWQAGADENEALDLRSAEAGGYGIDNHDTYFASRLDEEDDSEKTDDMDDDDMDDDDFNDDDDDLNDDDDDLNDDDLNDDDESDEDGDWGEVDPSGGDAPSAPGSAV